MALAKAGAEPRLTAVAARAAIAVVAIRSSFIGVLP
jgi:hypothetical protein